jgi:hypothetical protein
VEGGKRWLVEGPWEVGQVGQVEEEHMEHESLEGERCLLRLSERSETDCETQNGWPEQVCCQM